MTGALILYRNVYLLVALASMFRLQQGAGKVWTQFHHKFLHVNNIMHMHISNTHTHILLDFSLTVKAAPHECVIRTSQP